MQLQEGYMCGIRVNGLNLAWFLYEDGSRGAEVIRPYLDGFLGFYTADVFVDLWGLRDLRSV